MNKTLATVVSSVLALTAFAPPAYANGRFPESNAVFFSQADPDLVLLRVTFGLIASHDRGKTWDWICEQTIGLAGIEDPMFAVMPNGTYIGSTFQGLTLSRDTGCSFSFAGGALTNKNFIDLTTRPAEPNRVLAFACGFDKQDDAGDNLYESELFESTDQGKTFTQVGEALDPTLFGETVDLAPSDPERIYVSAVRAPGVGASAFLLTSRDHGKTYEEHPLALDPGERSAFIAAVDPTNADRVYVRTTSVAADAGGSGGPGRLLLSDDAGKTWRTLFASTSPLRGFALAADGSKVYVGTSTDGLRVANTVDFAWKKVSDIEVGCLALQGDGLWVCSTERSGFVLGRTTDEGATFDTKMHFCDLRGPLACPSDAPTTSMCGGETWQNQEFLLGCAADGVDAGSAGDGGRDAGPSPTPAPGQSGHAGPNEPGCSACSAAPGGGYAATGAAMASLGVACAFIARRRKKGPRRA